MFSKAAHREHIEFLVTKTALAAKNAGVPLPVSASRDPTYDWNMDNIMSGWRYPITEIEDGRLLSIRSAHSQSEHLVLPCPEIFRVMYAPHRILALALLAGPWNITAEQVLDPADSLAVDDGSNDIFWRIATVDGLGSDHATVVANLWLGTEGRAAANRLWLAIHATTGRRGVIAAVLPFEWDTLEIEVACIPLVPGGTGKLGTWFGYAINAVRWPDAPLGPPSKIEWMPDRRPPPENAERGDDPSLPSLPPADSPTPDPNAEFMDGDQRTDPSKRAGSVDIVGDGPVWLNSPEIVPIKREPTGTTGGSSVGGRNELETTSLSAGASARGTTHSALGQPQAVDPYGSGGIACDRFELVVAMLDQLEAKGSISSHGEVLPPRKQTAKRGARSVWAFADDAIAMGKLNHWYVRDFRRPTLGLREVRRTAMVRSIVVASAVVYWIEIEPRAPNKAFQALIFTETGTMRLERVITILLSNVALLHGVWPDSDVLRRWVQESAVSGILESKIWRHSTTTEDSGKGKEKPPSKILNYKRALEHIKAVADL